MSKFRHDLAFQPVRRMLATKIALIAVSMGMEKKENPLVRAIVSDDQLPQAERSVVVATEFLGIKFADHWGAPVGTLYGRFLHWSRPSGSLVPCKRRNPGVPRPL